jgi:hypothetical protein
MTLTRQLVRHGILQIGMAAVATLVAAVIVAIVL